MTAPDLPTALAAAQAEIERMRRRSIEHRKTITGFRLLNERLTAENRRLMEIIQAKGIDPNGIPSRNAR